MKLRSHCLIFGALFAAPAFALANSPMNLGEAVAFMQSQYPGQIVAAELDSTGDKPAHYHVDVRFAHGAIAKLEVDAVSRRIASRLPVEELAAGAMTLPETVTYISSMIPGSVTLAELDGSDGRHPHYHVDVRLVNDKVAHLRIDPGTRLVSWRNAPSLD